MTLATSTSLADALADVAERQVSLMIGFTDGPNGPGGGGVFLDHSFGMSFVSQTTPVPEPTPLPLAAAGASLLVLYLAARARLRRV